MYDIFDEKLEGTPEAKGRVRVPIVYVQKPAHTQAFTAARSTDPSFFKAGINLLVDLELLDSRPDHLHHRNSGLDTTSAKQCAANKVLVGINLANLRAMNPVVLGRVQQNIALCRKHGANMCVFSNAKSAAEFAQPQDVLSLLRVLGMSPLQAKQTLTNLERAYRAHVEKHAKANS